MAMAFSRLLVVASVGRAVLAMPSTEDVQLDTLAEDSECHEDASCTLNAMQLKARSKMGGDPVQAYGQCGGAKFTGSTTCAKGLVCAKQNDYYAQCEPAVQVVKSSKTSMPVHMKPLKANAPTPEPPHVKKLNPIVVKGNYLYDSATGKRWFSKGTSYNPRGDIFDKNGRSKGSNCVAGTPEVQLKYTGDVARDDLEEQWTQDLKTIANLGANTVRLFNVDANKDHTKFMKTAESFGIYVILPLNSKDFGFLPAFPSPSCYTTNMTHKIKWTDGEEREYGNVGVNVLSYGKQIVKQFSKFDNTLFFTVNNEFAMNDKDGFAGFQCVKALTRDIHRYQKSCAGKMRRVPLIYSDYDMGPPDRGIIAKYLTCALESEDDAIDVYGLNAYSYCSKEYPDSTGEDNFQYSPYFELRKDFQGLSVPMLFTEFGCVEGDFVSKCPYKDGRTWPDVKLFFGPEMNQYVSGAIAYTYSQDFEERGLVLTPNFLANQSEIYLLDNYYALQKEFKKHEVSSKWDGAETENCAWKPTDAAPQRHSHDQPTCPTTADGHAVQKRRSVSTLTDWAELPPAPDAPLSAVGQEECPADDLAAAIAAESKCHFKSESAAR